MKKNKDRSVFTLGTSNLIKQSQKKKIIFIKFMFKLSTKLKRVHRFQLIRTIRTELAREGMTPSSLHKWTETTSCSGLNKLNADKYKI